MTMAVLGIKTNIAITDALNSILSAPYQCSTLKVDPRIKSTNVIAAEITIVSFIVRI